MDAYLLLSDGSLFSGKSFGAHKEIIAETVFTTQLTGYLETLTDPSYFGQMVIQTFPLIGNYGVISPDFESKKPALSGYIVRSWCENPSNFRCEGTIDNFLKEHQIPGIYGIDTRALTKKIRNSGTMNGIITYDNPQDDIENYLKHLAAYQVTNAVISVTCKEKKEYLHGDSRKKIALYDFGAKENIARELFQRGFDVMKLPATTSAKEVLALHPDGVMLSNGPGDPADNVEIIKELKILLDSKLPLFGICLGHQLLALAAGAKTYKLKFGHRGANQPVKDLTTGRIYITSQNHGYAVDGESLPKTVTKECFINANDQSCEGIEYLKAPAFSVQFHPEACAGPLDTRFLFDRFATMINDK